MVYFTKKIPIALAKINITPKMKKEQPELSEKLLTYQDKCADVLASVFIDRKTISDMNMQPITETLNAITNTLTTLAQTMKNLSKRIITKIDECTEDYLCRTMVYKSTLT